MLKHKQSQPMAEINVVPYIDVMLVLLIIFMITAPLLTQGVQVDLPQAQSQALAQDSEPPVILSVDVNGQYFLNTHDDPAKAVDDETILTKVAAILQKSPKRPILVRGDKNVDYGKVVTAMVLLQQAGATSVGLITESPELEG